jgi:hypothetical protein
MQFPPRLRIGNQKSAFWKVAADDIRPVYLCSVAGELFHSPLSDLAEFLARVTTPRVGRHFKRDLAAYSINKYDADGLKGVLFCSLLRGARAALPAIKHPST